MELVFKMIHLYKYSLTEIENMLPWEKDIYVDLLRRQIEEENLRLLNRQNQLNAFRGRR
jgi:hypothetical protein